ncbi:sigma 54-interacting transcriptional regulator [bacterium]|nr:sigma 54-interacting transcriptional regulator [bacterium]
MEMVHFIPPGQRKIAVLAAQADDAPVLISGSSGTGKGAMARWIHANGPRAIYPFIVADRDKPLVQQMAQAQGGTFMVSDLGERPLGEQMVLLNFLNTRSVPSDEGQMPRLLNVRIIATTDQDLEGRASGGLFNSSLFEKFGNYKIEMPALTERSDEFEDLVYGVMTEITRELHKEHLRGFTSAAWAKLRGYEWPGNLRELRNVLRMAIVSAKGDEILDSDLPDLGNETIDFRATREEFEKIYLLELLKSYDWQIDKTCRASHLDEQTLMAKIQKYGISADKSISP